MLPNIYHILPNHDVEYEQYGGAFLSIIHIAKVLLTEGGVFGTSQRTGFSCHF